MKITVRDLTIADLDQLLDIMSCKNKITGINISDYDLEYFKQEISLFLVPYPNTHLGRVLGYFEDDILVSFLTQQFTERGPMWYMTMLGTRSTHRWNYKLNGLEDCWTYAMARAERNQIYKVLWTMPASWSRTQRRTLKTTDVWHRYNIYYDGVIPAGEMPVWPEHKSVFGKIVKDHDVLIKSAVLKNDYRPDYLKLQM